MSSLMLADRIVGRNLATTLAALAASRGAGLAYQAGRWVIIVGTVTIVGVLARRLARLTKDSVARFRQAFDDSALGIALIGNDLRILEANDSLCGMLGRARDDLVGSGSTTWRA